MIKRYSIPTEEKAKELILLLELEPNQTVSKDIEGIVYWGFEDKYNDDNELILKGETYNIDVYWKAEPLDSFNEFEVNPTTPSHE